MRDESKWEGFSVGERNTFYSSLKAPQLGGVFYVFGAQTADIARARRAPADIAKAANGGEYHPNADQILRDFRRLQGVGERSEHELYWYLATSYFALDVLRCIAPDLQEEVLVAMNKLEEELVKFEKRFKEREGAKNARDKAVNDLWDRHNRAALEDRV